MNSKNNKENKDIINVDSRNFLINLSNTKIYKLAYYLTRIKQQGLSKDKKDRKDFIKWLSGDVEQKKNHKYNPLFTAADAILNESYNNYINQPGRTIASANPIINEDNHKDILETEDYESIIKKYDCDNDNKNNKLLDYINWKEKIYHSKKAHRESANKISKLIKEKDYRGIIIYPNVVHFEPQQTPQQLLKEFSKHGYLCFFCEQHDYINDIEEINGNLYLVKESDLLQSIKDEEVLLLITNVCSMGFADKFNNKKIWYHVLDSLTVNGLYNQMYEELHSLLVKEADYVTYVSKSLINIINRQDALYLPNAVNVEEIKKQIQDSSLIPSDIKHIVERKHPIIGYYGYISRWMDLELVKKVSIKYPECEFVFIGGELVDTSEIKKLANVHLLGEKKYSELSNYAKLFDVAIIPFKINEEMDCVSPIKFYEYCTYGIPVISSHMKELEQYDIKYNFINLYHNEEEFYKLIEKSLDSKTKEDARNNSRSITLENTWSSRTKLFDYYFSKHIKNDYIIFSIIDYDFRYQRPQHFSKNAVENGHRVFYIETEFNLKDSSYVNYDGVNVVKINCCNSPIYDEDFDFGFSRIQTKLDNLIKENNIRECTVIVNYPNWYNCASYLKNNYGFKIVTDYMDDFSGFLNPIADKVKNNCEKLLVNSDYVIASSDYLANIAQKYNKNINIIRNGTEYNYFHTALNKDNINNRKIIGYYGAIAEWFDMDLVCECAEQFPECDIYLIGNITNTNTRYTKYQNIKVFGEIKYSNLVDYLKTFDVCIIPFDTSTELIKATNPVKFYEYLSAGKKIVATEIPELAPYKDTYAYLENDTNEFCKKISMCLNNEDNLVSKPQMFDLALQSDWSSRYQLFENEFVKVYKKISIIVLCYNQLSYTKECIKSIIDNTKYPNYEIIIIDNLSTDGTRDYLKSLNKNKKIKVILNDKNVGFAGGNNIGIKESDGEYVVLLNNDVIVTEGWLSGLMKHVENDNTIGEICPTTNNIGNEACISTNYSNINQINDFSNQRYYKHINEEYVSVRAVALFCTMIPRKVIEKVGLLDDKYERGMFEDDDYSLAVKKAGYRICVANDIFVHHYGSASFNSLGNEEKRAVFEKNKNYFEKKWNTKWIAHKYRSDFYE